MATGQELSLSGFAASFATGAFFGAVGSVAGMAGGSLAKALGQAASSPFAKLFAGLTIMGTSAFTDVVRGERDPTTIFFNAGVSALGARGVGKLFPTRGMSTLRQSQFFAPRTLGAFGRALIDPANAGSNSISVLYGGLAKGMVVSFSKGMWSWYDERTG